MRDRHPRALEADRPRLRLQGDPLEKQERTMFIKSAAGFDKVLISWAKFYCSQKEKKFQKILKKIKNRSSPPKKKKKKILKRKFLTLYIHFERKYFLHTPILKENISLHTDFKKKIQKKVFTPFFSEKVCYFSHPNKTVLQQN